MRIGNGSIFSNDAAVVEGQNAIAMVGGQHVVGDQKNRTVEFPVQVIEKVEDFLARVRIEIAGGFITEKQGRSEDKRPGDGDALALAAGERVGQMRSPVLNPTRSSMPRARCSPSRRRKPCKRSGKATFSTAVRVDNKLNVWKIIPIFSRRMRVLASSPSAESSTPSI